MSDPVRIGVRRFKVRYPIRLRVRFRVLRLRRWWWERRNPELAKIVHDVERRAVRAFVFGDAVLSAREWALLESNWRGHTAPSGGSIVSLFQAGFECEHVIGVPEGVDLGDAIEQHLTVVRRAAS